MEGNNPAFPEAAKYCDRNGVDEDMVLRGINIRFTKDTEVVEAKDANEVTMQFRKTKTDQLGFGEICAWSRHWQGCSELGPPGS